MTSGERMVWAATFALMLRQGAAPASAAYQAGCAVLCLRGLSDGLPTTEDRVMLDDMLSTGGDR